MFIGHRFYSVCCPEGVSRETRVEKTGNMRGKQGLLKPHRIATEKVFVLCSVDSYDGKMLITGFLIEK